MTLAENLKRIRETKGLSQVRLANKAKVSQQLISRLEAGRDLTTKKLPQLASALGVLVTDLDPAYVVETPEIIVTAVPVLSWVPAGDWWLPEQIVEGDDLPTVAIPDLPPGDWAALTVEGSSMDRISPPGSLILINRRDKRLAPNACYVIADEEGRATYKRYRPSPPRFEPVTFTEGHETIFPKGPVNVIGRVRRSIIDM